MYISRFGTQFLLRSNKRPIGLLYRDLGKRSLATGSPSGDSISCYELDARKRVHQSGSVGYTSNAPLTSDTCTA